MPRLFYPFLVYRSFFFPFFVLSLIAVPCWMLVRLYRLRATGQAVSIGHEILLVIFVIYLCGLATATLTPNHGSSWHAGRVVLHPNLGTLTCSSRTMASGSSGRFFCLYNARGNVLLFVPLGILIPLLWRRLGFWRGMLIAIAVSIGIEVVQYFSSAWGSYRTADVNDVILNAAGAFFGLTLVFLLLRLRALGAARRTIRE